jgi:hypothetical protein
MKLRVIVVLEILFGEPVNAQTILKNQKEKEL